MTSLKEIEKNIYDLYESVNKKCKDLKDNYEKKRLEIIRKEGDCWFKHSKTKTYKLYASKQMIVREKYINTEVFKSYIKEYERIKRYELIDKKIKHKYEQEQKMKQKELGENDDIYFKTKEYLSYIKEKQKITQDFLKSKYVKDLKECSFKHCKQEYKHLIKLLIPYYKKEKKQIYNFLNKLNIQSITFSEYEKITFLFNNILKFNLFSYISPQ